MKKVITILLMCALTAILVLPAFYRNDVTLLLAKGVKFAATVSILIWLFRRHRSREERFIGKE